MAKKNRYTLKQLCNLWIIWLTENNINIQEFYEKYNLEGSFIYWLEKKKKTSS
jgi:hypothetical protein